MTNVTRRARSSCLVLALSDLHPSKDSVIRAVIFETVVSFSGQWIEVLSEIHLVTNNGTQLAVLGRHGGRTYEREGG